MHGNRELVYFLSQRLGPEACKNPIVVAVLSRYLREPAVERECLIEMVKHLVKHSEELTEALEEMYRTHAPTVFKVGGGK